MKRRSWVWLLGLGLAATICMNASAQDRRGHGGHDRHHSRGKSDYHKSGKGSLFQKVYRVTQADSAQKVKMKPALDKTTKRLEALRLNYQKQEKRVLDSLSLQMKPYLKEDQLKRLTDWRDKAGRSK